MDAFEGEDREEKRITGSKTSDWLGQLRGVGCTFVSIERWPPG